MTDQFITIKEENVNPDKHSHNDTKLRFRWLESLEKNLNSSKTNASITIMLQLMSYVNSAGHLSFQVLPAKSAKYIYQTLATAADTSFVTSCLNSFFFLIFSYLIYIYVLDYLINCKTTIAATTTSAHKTIKSFTFTNCQLYCLQCSSFSFVWVDKKNPIS